MKYDIEVMKMPVRCFGVKRIDNVSSNLQEWILVLSCLFYDIQFCEKESVNFMLLVNLVSVRWPAYLMI